MTTSSPAGALVVAPEPVAAPDSAALLRAYYRDIVDRYYRQHEGRPATAAEIDGALADEPSDHLVAPHGVFLVARRAGEPAGCAGVHLLSPGTAELTRVYVAAGARRRGLGGRLLAAAETAAREVLGATTLRLDTRDDLTEARAMYARSGYAAIPAPYPKRYADHWFAKDLTA
ncbi:MULTISPECIES: GNAT family N-acetyltransferase [Streptomycetaceae]|uniref:Acetyltransferase n=1 Tax=Streptantibioticus cattleyicolor (strain ATCC 35852 / DSM 46488 / JCM 4925 / NBRC 14057 / NRRL 8057) TaxID=1003195 RepID=F8JZM1_STREN|nr:MULTISPECIES: GNAT family N-acetyltransferase [Streptomycetaceae]AEW97322.1 acetyltransferase [Streptantibioticus cattleyicolor NRRL 8057 = DSM 46488]MYS61774.1 GNAT family N-acetyltransferase [Streptomyces sp. SID5468]CCB77644.1 Acetyltransferase [Streptantibioticus cattleyicolor NRRL 8057 = DSM 46488]